MIFAGVWLEADHMNQTIWADFGLEKLLSRTVYDHVGTADIVCPHLCVFVCAAKQYELPRDII